MPASCSVSGSVLVHGALILATGGTGLVRAAYSSGKPAYGVGPGNVPAYIDRSADIAAAASAITSSQSFDNGTLCCSEQGLILDKPIAKAFIAELVKRGAHVCDDDETKKLGRLANVGSNAAGWISDEQKESIARGLAEMGQTRTWNLLIDVIAQTGHYGPNAQNLTDFIPEGEKRYWLHIALGRDLIQGDGLPCGTTPGAACQVDVLGTQLEEVTE